MEHQERDQLLQYFRSLLNDPSPPEVIPENLGGDEIFLEIDKTIKTIRGAGNALGVGDLSYKINGGGYTLGVFKNLQAAFRNLTWQTKAIASGDFSQKVDFMGEFSEAFNSMAKKLEESIYELNESKELFEMVFQTIPDTVLLTTFEEGRIFAYNRAFLELTGYEKEEVENRRIFDISFYRDIRQRKVFTKELRKNGSCRNMQILLKNKNGENIVSLYSSQITNIKGHEYILSVIKDITPMKKIEDRLRESEERHRLLADNVSDVIWTMNLEGKLTYVSPSVEKLLGYNSEEVMKQSSEELLSKQSLVHMENGLKIARECVLNNISFKPFRDDIEILCNDGKYVWTDTTVSAIHDKDGKFISMVGVSRDISDRKKMEAEIRRLSVTDKLTQLFNRLKLDETLKIEMERSNRSEKTFSLIIMDIDFFKKVNDTFGHQTGDLVLVEMAEILKQDVRITDIPGRWGGEEFMVILPETNKEGALKLAEKLRMQISMHDFQEAGRISASFGVSTSKSGDSILQLVARADDALYKAKQNGRNRVEFSE